MPRLTREQSRALTRTRLLDAARTMFLRDGYGATSVDRIAETAGFSKGALYSNFDGKEAIFLAVLEAHGDESLDGLIAALDQAADKAALIDILATWANDRTRSGNWSLTVLEHARTTPGATAPQARILRAHWQRLGVYLLGRFPDLACCNDVDAETLGALLHEIAYAPAMTFVDRPDAGALMRVVLHALLDRQS